MQHDEPLYFMENGTVFLACPVNVLSDIMTLKEIHSVAISSWIYTRGSNNTFCPHQFAEGYGMGELELTLSKTKELEDFNLHALSPSMRGQLVEAVCSNQSPGGGWYSPAFGNQG